MGGVTDSSSLPNLLINAAFNGSGGKKSLLSKSQSFTNTPIGDVTGWHIEKDDTDSQDSDWAFYNLRLDPGVYTMSMWARGTGKYSLGEGNGKYTYKQEIVTNNWQRYYYSFVVPDGQLVENIYFGVVGFNATIDIVGPKLEKGYYATPLS